MNSFLLLIPNTSNVPTLRPQVASSDIEWAQNRSLHFTPFTPIISYLHKVFREVTILLALG